MAPPFTVRRKEMAAENPEKGSMGKDEKISAP